MMAATAARMRENVREQAKGIDIYLHTTPSVNAQHIEAAIARLPDGFQVIVLSMLDFLSLPFFLTSSSSFLFA